MTDLHDAQRQRVDAWALVLLGLLIIGLLCIPLRVLHLQMSPPPELAAAAGQTESTARAMGRRGDLLDRRGRVLATSTVGWRVFVDPKLVQDPATLGTRLGAMLGLEPDDIDNTLAGRLDRRYVPVSGDLSDAEVLPLRTSPITGVGLEPRPIRHYPNGADATALVGMVGFEHTGLAGMEHAMQRRLEGRPGSITAVRDPGRRTLWVTPDNVVPAQPGDDVRLSIDLAVQSTVTSRLQTQVNELNAAGGRAVVLDPMSGEVLAVVDVRGLRATDTDADPRLARSRCVTDPYEPGSTFKPFVWAAAIESAVITQHEVLPTPEDRPHRTSKGRRIRDSHYYGPSSFRTVLVKSLNSGMAIAAERLTHGQLRSYVDELGFGQPSGCGLPGETGGIVTAHSDWSHYTQTSVAMGHEISVTVLQMARAFAAFARDGTMPDITIFARDDRGPMVQQRVYQPATVLAARDAMCEVMTDGTGRRIQSGLYSMFGKSGTAQLPIAEGGGYHEDRYISSFIAGAPVDDPQVVVLCVIDDPDRSLGRWYGSSTAGPVVRDIIDATLPYLGVQADLQQQAQIDN